MFQLIADTEVNVKNGAEVLDRLIKVCVGAKSSACFSKEDDRMVTHIKKKFLVFL